MSHDDYSTNEEKPQDLQSKPVKKNSVITRLKKKLPEIIATSARFFRVGSDKKPHQPEWNKVKNQLSLDNLELQAGECVGFCTSGTPDFALLDFDHILNKNGEYVNDATRFFVEEIKELFPNIYTEKSISGTGLHMFLLPSKKFKRAAPYVVNLGDNAKLEIFYRTKGRYCLVTGKTPAPENKGVPTGECADKFLALWLKEETRTVKKNIASLPAFDTETQVTALDVAIQDTIVGSLEDSDTFIECVLREPAKTECVEKNEGGVDETPCNTPSETSVVLTGYDDIDKRYDYCRAVEMLRLIDVKALNDNEWLDVMTVCKNMQIDAKIVDEFNLRDPDRYNLEGNQSRIESLNDKSFGIQNLHAIAQKFGYNEKEFWAEYHAQSRRENCDVYANLASVKCAVEKLKTECVQAMGVLESIDTFDAATLFAKEVVYGAACARLLAFDYFVDFKGKIKARRGNSSVSLTDWNNVVNREFEPLFKQYAELQNALAKAEGAVTNYEYIEENPVLKGFTVPTEFVLSDKGISKIVTTEKGATKLVPVVGRPIVITAARYSIADNHMYFTLQYKTMDKWRKLPPQSAVTVFDARRIIELTKMNLPIDSAQTAGLVGFLNTWRLENEQAIAQEYVSKTGYQEFDEKTCMFVDTRLRLSYNNVPVVVEDNSFTELLKSKGTFEEWLQNVFGTICTEDIALFLLGAALSTPLLKILGERNFVVYVYGDTRVGKSTALIAAMSAIGNERLIKSFDSTLNGLVGLAAESNDYPLAVDEKQNVDGKLGDSLTRLVYAIANGTGRLKLNKDSSLRQVQYWRTILLCNGEVPLVEENVTGGAYSRLVQIHLPGEIFSSEQCRTLRVACKKYYGTVFPKIVEKFNEKPADFWENKFDSFVAELSKKHPDILSEYCRYVAIVSITLEILWEWYLENVPIENVNAGDAAQETAEFILETMPTIDSISDTQREWDILTGFIAQNQRLFVSSLVDTDKLPKIYGAVDNKTVFITNAALTDCCKANGLNKTKVINDMFDSGKFKAPKYTPKGKTRASGKLKRIGAVVTRVFELAENILDIAGTFDSEDFDAPPKNISDPGYDFEENGM